MGQSPLCKQVHRPYTPWAEEKFVPGESILTFEARGNMGAVVTNLRAFGFSARTARWTVKRFELK